jgi:hypothetical protein
MSHDRASEYWHGGQSHGFDPLCPECIEEMRAKGKATMADDDFGFSAVNAEDVVAVIEANPKNVKMSMIKIFDKINPLLKKLEDNPDKDYIHWPNRQERIRQFREDLQTLIKEEAETYGKE